MWESDSIKFRTCNRELKFYRKTCPVHLSETCQTIQPEEGGCIIIIRRGKVRGGLDRAEEWKSI